MWTTAGIGEATVVRILCWPSRGNKGLQGQPIHNSWPLVHERSPWKTKPYGYLFRCRLCDPWFCFCWQVLYDLKKHWDLTNLTLGSTPNNPSPNPGLQSPQYLWRMTSLGGYATLASSVQNLQPSIPGRVDVQPARPLATFITVVYWKEIGWQVGILVPKRCVGWVESIHDYGMWST